MKNNHEQGQTNKAIKDLTYEEYRELLVDVWKGGYRPTEEEAESMTEYEQAQEEAERFDKLIEEEKKLGLVPIYTLNPVETVNELKVITEDLII